jgi:phenylalanine-4-hydroxylase
MLGSVPPEYLVGLDSVVLTSTDALSRKRRRSKTWSRKRTVKVVKTRGLYHYAQKGKTAWIEIFVDRIFDGWEVGFWLKLPLVRDFLLAPVLFHEIGHHIHATVRPEFQEREDVADRWQVKLETIYYRKERPYLRLFSTFAKPFHPAIKRILAADAARH